MKEGYSKDENVVLNVISGTDIGALMGRNPYVSTYDIWLKRKHGYVKKVSSLPRVIWGIDMEDNVGRHYLKYVVDDPKVRIIKPETTQVDYKFASPDFIVESIESFEGIDLVNPLYGLEIKTARTRWETLPKQYEYQCRWYMALLGFDTWVLHALHFEDMSTSTHTITRDLEIEKVMLDVAETFYNTYLVGNQEPVDIETAKETKTTLVESEIAGDIITEIKALSKSIKEFTEQSDALKDKLKAIIGENKGVVCGDFIATWKTQERTSLDMDGLTKAYGITDDEVQLFRKKNSFRVLRIS